MQQVAFLTQHGKLPLLVDALSVLDWQLQLVDGFDTDLLGSFAGERGRFMTPAECALRKAAIAAELAGTSLGIGSEGSFNAGPYGLGTVNQEILCCVNLDAGWAVWASAERLCSARSWQITSMAEVQAIIPTLPQGQLLLLKQGQQIAKALTTTDCEAQIGQWLTQGAVTLEYDLRAHCSPERQDVIRAAADNLKQRLQAQCPVCMTPGFWPEHMITGLPCADCGQQTAKPRGHRACCQRCGHQVERWLPVSFADPAYCTFCNP